MSKHYLVMFEVEEGEWMYASAENPFTYESKPLIFDSKDEAGVHAKKYNTGVVVEQTDIRPFDVDERARARVRAAINNGV
tara:strand:+ start:58 stop:297 length:240 start_codon:yes stop_codon:yes gene_type:complete